MKDLAEEVKHEFHCAIDLRQQDQKEFNQSRVDSREFSDVLVIVTGGTLTMVQSEQGYVPAKGLADRLRVIKTFNDLEFRRKRGIPDSDEVLITPISPFNSRIRFRVTEFDELIDSSCVTLEDQQKMAKLV